MVAGEFSRNIAAHPGYDAVAHAADATTAMLIIVLLSCGPGMGASLPQFE